MIGVPKTPQETLSQLYPLPGSSNSWAIGVGEGSRAGKRELYTARTPYSGSNSWARLDEEVAPVKKQVAARPTYALMSVPRGTYGNKPLPLIPEAPPPPYTPRLTPRKTHADKPKSPFPKAFPSLGFVARLKKHAGIKPTGGLADLGHDLKTRAVTDPVIPNLWFPHRDEAVFQCHEKNTGAVRAAKGSEKSCSKISPQPSVANTSKEAQISDAYPPEDKNQTELPVSDLPSNISLSSLSISNLDHSISPVNLVRQRTSKTDPSTRHLLEDTLTTLALSDRYHNKRGILKGGGVRKPRRTSNFSETRRVHFAATKEKRRPLSQARVIENEVCMNNKQGENKTETTIPPPGHSPTEGSEQVIAYSKSDYGEENQSSTVNSHVRSIPCLPTSYPSHPQYLSKTQLQHRPQGLVAVMPMIEESETGTSPQLLPASPGVWWTADSRGNSFTSSSIHPSLIVAPLFAGQDRINAVPAPPASSYPEYQQMRPTPADLARLELNLHHHMDSGFSCLTKHFADKTDRILDQLVRRLEGLENKVEKDMKNVESKVTEVKAECANLGQENRAILKELDVMRDSMRGLDLKLELMSGNLEENRCKDHCRQGTLSGSEPQNLDRAQAVPRRSQDSVARDSPGSDQQRQAQTSVHSSQGHRSSPFVAGRAVGSNKNILAQTEGMDHQPPDLKDHPAFASGQSNHPLTCSEPPSEESGSVVKGMLPLFQTPSFRDGGWYKQAYGQ